MTKKGFTFVEITVVIVILAIIATIGSYAYFKSIERSKVAEVVANVRHYKEAIDNKVLAKARDDKVELKAFPFLVSANDSLSDVIKLKNTNYFVKDGDGGYGNLTDISLIVGTIDSKIDDSIIMIYAIGSTEDCILGESLYVESDMSNFYEEKPNANSKKYGHHLGITSSNFCAIELSDNLDDFHFPEG